MHSEHPRGPPATGSDDYSDAGRPMAVAAPIRGRCGALVLGPGGGGALGRGPGAGWRGHRAEPPLIKRISATNWWIAMIPDVLESLECPPSGNCNEL